MALLVHLPQRPELGGVVVVNGDPVLFSALAPPDSATVYGFACTVCGRHAATEPDAVCAACAKSANPTKSSRRRVVKSRAR